MNKDREIIMSMTPRVHKSSVQQKCKNDDDDDDDGELKKKSRRKFFFTFLILQKQLRGEERKVVFEAEIHNRFCGNIGKLENVVEL